MSNAIQAHRERVGRKIRLARLSANMSHDQLAAKVGTSRQHLIKLEKGQHLARPEMLAKIAEATKKSERFFESDDDEESDPVADLFAAFLRVVDHRVTERVKALAS